MNFSYTHDEGKERALENYENNTYSENYENPENAEELASDVTAEEAELIDAQIIEDDGMEAEASDETEEIEEIEEDEAPEKEEEDISLVAEMLSAMRNPFVSPEEPESDAESDENEESDEAEEAKPKEKLTDECGLFSGFTLKKALVTAAAVLLTLAMLAASMAAAVAVASDKTKRASDYDMITDAETEAKLRSEYEKQKNAEVEKDPENDPGADNGEEPGEDPVPAQTQYRVTLDFFDRDDIELYSTEMTLGELLDESGIVIEEGEATDTPLDTVIDSDTTVVFDKYEYSTYVETTSIPYETEARETDLIPRGSTKLIQEGVAGEGRNTYKQTVKNGEIIDSELISEETVTWPQTYIYEIGVGGTLTGSDGKTYSYSYRKTVKATYYYLPNDPHTYLGNTPNHQTVAVDMNVIPLGTWFYVKNSRYDFGLRQAQDIGGAVKGDMIDIWLDGSEAGYSAFSREGVVNDMEIYFVD